MMSDLVKRAKLDHDKSQICKISCEQCKIETYLNAFFFQLADV